MVDGKLVSVVSGSMAGIVPGDSEGTVSPKVESVLSAVIPAGWGVTGEIAVPCPSMVRTVDFLVSDDAGVPRLYVEVKKPAVDLHPSGWTRKSDKHNRTQFKDYSSLDSVVYCNGMEWVWFRRGVEYERYDASDGAGVVTMLTAACDADPLPIDSVNMMLGALVPVAVRLQDVFVAALRSEKRAAKTSGAMTPVASAMESLVKSGMVTTGDRAEDMVARAAEITNVYVFTQLAAKGGFGHNSDAELLGHVQNVMVKASGQDAAVAVARSQVDRVLDAVSWHDMAAKVDSDLYETLFEDYLDKFNRAARFSSGSFYTPSPVSEFMMRFTDEVLSKFPTGPDGEIVPLENQVYLDPFCGTGTFPAAAVHRVAGKVDDGTVSPVVLDRFVEGMHLWDKQVTPYAIAHDRLGSMLDAVGCASRPNMMVRDSFADRYHGQEDPLALFDADLHYVAQAAKAEWEFADKGPVGVVVTNPPYLGDATSGNQESVARLKEWSPGDMSSRIISNLYVEGIRAAVHHVFEKNPEDTGGVVAVIVPSSCTMDSAFATMRESLCATASNIWVVNVTPGGYMHNKIFAISTAVSIIVIHREHNADPDAPANVHYLKAPDEDAEGIYRFLDGVTVDSAWLPVTNTGGVSWQGSADGWDEWPGTDDVLPWSDAGMSTNRKWVSSADQRTLDRRVDHIMDSSPGNREELFKAIRNSSGWSVTPKRTTREMGLIGDIVRSSTIALCDDESAAESLKANPVEVTVRPMVTELLTSDTRAWLYAKHGLWGARDVSEDQTYLTVPMSVVRSGQNSLTASRNPSLHMYIPGNSERVHPAYHPDGSPNVAPEILAAVETATGSVPSGRDVVDYVMGVVAHPGYTDRFTDELDAKIVRVPVTLDAGLWRRGVELGHRVSALQSHDMQDMSMSWVREVSGVEPGVSFVPGHHATEMPEGSANDWLSVDVKDGETLGVFQVGDLALSGVDPAVLDYRIGGVRVIKAWLERHLSVPFGRKKDGLEAIMPDTWHPEWSQELFNLVSVVTVLMRLEVEQDALLDDVVAGELFTGATTGARKVRWPEDGEGDSGLF